MTLNWNSLKTAENGWKLDAAQRHRIYDNCLRGEKVGGFQWQYVWKPAAYLATAAAVFMIALFLWQPKSEPKTVVTPGAAPAPIVPDSSAEGETQDAIEPEYTFDDYGQDAIYERIDGDVRSIYRAFLGMKTAPQKLAEDADLLMVQDDYMVYNQQGKLCVMNLKEGGTVAVVGDAAVRAIEGWEDHVLLYQIGANPGEYQTVLLTLSEQKRTVYEKDYYIADATRIGDTLYYTEWKYETTEGKELKAYSFADGSVETYCRIRTGSDPYEFYLADGRLYYLDEALMYCDLQTKETHQALKPVGFSDRYPCVRFKDRLYMNTMDGFLIYDLKTQAVVYETTEAVYVCCSNQNGVVYYDSSQKEFTVIHADSSFTFDASGYESIYDQPGGGTVCEQGFALKYE
ncbi:MAG: hypothetical protein IJN82_07280, partial [Clostridia bacterium]|nr:hypothetical protein [Clostridia bacterium]